MLRWCLSFLACALIAGIFGFGVIVTPAMGIARSLCYLFLLLSVVSLIAGVAHRNMHIRPLV